MKKTQVLVASVACALACSAISKAAVITQWTFDSYTAGAAGTSSGAIAPDTGTGSLSITHALSSTYSTPAGNGTTKSLSSNTFSSGDYYQFSAVLGAATPGLELEFAQVSSSTGPTSFQLEYSTDGTNYVIPTSLTGGGLYTVSNSISFSTTAAKTTNPPEYLFDFTGITPVETATTIYFRLIDQSATGAAAGTDRVDTVTVGTNLPAPTVPEPASIGVIATAAALLLRRRTV